MFATVSLAFAGISTCTIYVFTPILKNLFFFITGQPLVREQPFPAVWVFFCLWKKKIIFIISLFFLHLKSYPYIDQYSDDAFLPCYIHLSHGGYCTAIGFNGIDSIFITACFHIAAQFQLATMKIQSSLKLPTLKPLNASENAKIRRILIDVIEDQVKLFDLTDLFIKVFNSIILMHFISVAIIIGIGSMDLFMVCIDKLENSLVLIL